ncbi:hypothetical protein [Croceicoccus gelatinilyticus]|uniref:DUF7831 domain-containing protein n=1 Tax=Croceicoccus gelatinilyticus TaxID=2835536 RepID=UPI001BD0841F|nr:hypothetical protein [Croceicoccus gelatinilyticus]MBS7671356.1 hypothetical protein [Croceicoccus gelatinilyticus]
MIHIADRPYTRSYIRTKPDWLFVFEDLLDNNGSAYSADIVQREIRGEPNTVGIVTKRMRGTAPFCYMTDEDARPSSQAYLRLLNDFARIENNLRMGKNVVFPTATMGLDVGDLLNKAPAYWGLLEQLRLKLFRRYRLNGVNRAIAS